MIFHNIVSDPNVLVPGTLIEITFGAYSDKIRTGWAIVVMSFDPIKKWGEHSSNGILAHKFIKILIEEGFIMEVNVPMVEMNISMGELGLL